MNYLSEINGAGGIVAKVVAYSSSVYSNTKIITFELTYPRIIHAEMLTHRLFSRNAASSRAIPVSKINQMIADNPAMPVRFGANQPGMQDKGMSHTDEIWAEWEDTSGLLTPEQAWTKAAKDAIYWSDRFSETGYHKQVCNRLTEPFQFMRTVVTFTGDGDNFYGLRYHTDADPTIGELARCMYEAQEAAKSSIRELNKGDWHLPYYKDGYWLKGADKGLKTAQKVSASCCAQASFRSLDASEEKAERVFSRLVETRPVHASPVEHQATPISPEAGFRSKFVTAVDREGNVLSGNFKNWGQWRQIIPDHQITKFVLGEKDD